MYVPSVCGSRNPHDIARDFDLAVESARVGLSNAHIRARRWIEVADGAPYVRAREVGVRQVRTPDRCRGEVSSFSEASRRRLMALGAKIKTSAMQRALFVTLTYPGEYTPDSDRWKRDLRTFIERVRRKWPRAAVVWKLEFQERGAPHFHLIVLNVPYMAHQWVARAWYEVAATGDPDHLAAGTEVRRVKRQGQVMYYVSKYIAKPGVNVPTDHSGRFWGVSGREFLPVDVRQLPCDEQTYEAVLGSMKRLIGWTGDPLDKLTYSRGLWLAVDRLTKRRILRWLPADVQA